MSNGNTDFTEQFRLRPTRAAKVSEISEATASSGVPPEERVNFHIGNPVQDRRLSAAYLRAALGLRIDDETVSAENSEDLLQALGCGADDGPAVELIGNLVRRSAPYLPRGGFARTSPSPLVLKFSDWLLQQQEPLAYDLGKASGRREIILASGGIAETLRVFFHALSQFLLHTPARLLQLGIELPAHAIAFELLRPETLTGDEESALSQARSLLEGNGGSPTFLVIGSQTSEHARRFLRSLAMQHPLFFLEVNDAPNHVSLARESRLVQRVIRFLTPGVFSPRFRSLPLVFVAGNADYLALLETIHFQLKGTPSASEAELLAFLLDRPCPGDCRPASTLPVESPMEGAAWNLPAETAVVRHAHRVEVRLQSILAGAQEIADTALGRMESRIVRIAGRAASARLVPAMDRFAGISAPGLVRELEANAGAADWQAELEAAFLRAFVRHHPEYDFDRCLVVSGSSRTALGLLGFHCGIREAVVPDLSWTYEHCFSTVQAVPLTPQFDLDAGAMLAAVEARIHASPGWTEYGAVVLNNPHNATGSVFDRHAVRYLLRRLLERGVTVIDDLSYQNVAPTQDLPEIPTLRQTADELVLAGEISSSQAEAVVTVHSISKTDSLAGARLSVVEIRRTGLFERFEAVNQPVKPNIGAILLAYLFYRNSLEVARGYWSLRNRIFLERIQVLQQAVRNLPAGRNPHGIGIRAPRGSMYPLMTLDELPAGLSLEWIASGLARQGIGMIPLSTFARTEKGFEAARKAFRLTLGGTDGGTVLSNKTRRVLIDLNRLIAEQGASYSRRPFPHRPMRSSAADEDAAAWSGIESALLRMSAAAVRGAGSSMQAELKDERVLLCLQREFVPDRLGVYRQRFLDRARVARETMAAARAGRGRELAATLQSELHRDSLARREQAFRGRLFDRTVHPTQMYSIRTERAFDALIQSLLRGRTASREQLEEAARRLLNEFLGFDVAITSSEEGNEAILDLDAQIAAELFGEMHEAGLPRAFVSFWGDWDGSNRPSGQGHSLAASVLIENVSRLSRLLRTLVQCDPAADADPELRKEIESLPRSTTRFFDLLRAITALTHQLEGRYRGVLPFTSTPGRVRRLAMSLHLARDPVSSLWYHNDRLERRMLDLRRRRREALEYYFALNKRLRKELYRLVPVLMRNLSSVAVLREAALYRDLLQRFVITPRISQPLITAHDPFAIDTTVFNINEINDVAGRYGNPGMVLALQISLSTKPEALIVLDRKMRARREHVLRDHPDTDLPVVWLVPLFEDQHAVGGIVSYMNKIWEYALQSRRVNQETGERFTEIIEEVFIAGSDLSQQVGQAAGSLLFRQAKYDLVRWLAERGVPDRVRIKMGSGEPMQRQGGYYNRVSGEPAFLTTGDAERRLAAHLRGSTRRSAVYATTPVLGVFAGGDLRTFQSSISEKMRQLPLESLAELLNHVCHAQRTRQQDLSRATAELSETRMQSTRHGEQALERLTVGTRDPVFEQFLKELTSVFRQILYGREEDVVGIHIISYFIARTTPPLRDRPTVRPSQNGKQQGSRILERIARTIPLSRYGSMLRAIAHNQAQTAVLGINQLTTGLFRALDEVARFSSAEGDPEVVIADHVLPNLPVYEVLHSLRLYHDVSLTQLAAVERAFHAGNSALLALREDLDAMARYIPLLQQELLRRHGIDIGDFFEANRFLPQLLPALRPDLAVLLQPDLFNTELERLRSSIGGSPEQGWLEAVARLLAVPEKIRGWRAKAWSLLERPVFQRVQSFAELAVALHSLSSQGAPQELPAPGRDLKLSSSLAHFFRMTRADDEMRQFLAAAIEYLNAASEGMVELPASVVRAMREVERIAAIEEQALAPEQQDRLRFYLLQIARIAQETG